MIIQVEKLNSQVPFPTRGTELSACYDLGFYPSEPKVEAIDPDGRGGMLYMLHDDAQGCDVLTIPPGYRAMLPTGLIFHIPAKHYIRVYARSSVAYKRGLVMVNSVGIIDEDYRHEVKALLMNVTNQPVHLKVGERLMQFELINTCPPITFFTEEGERSEVVVLSKRMGGIGSTGA
jgi:dUTP pyrophosphatase